MYLTSSSSSRDRNSYICMNSTNWPRSQCVASQLSWSSIAPVSRRSWVRIPLKPWYFQASSFQLLKLENLLRWSLFTFRNNYGGIGFALQNKEKYSSINSISKEKKKLTDPLHIPPSIARFYSTLCYLMSTEKNNKLDSWVYEAFPLRGESQYVTEL